MSRELDSYGPGDLRFRIVERGVTLMELSDISFSLSSERTPSGSGLGFLQNLRHKATAASSGEWSVTRSALSKQEDGELFLEYIYGRGTVIRELVASGSTTHTLGTLPMSVSEVRFITSNIVLVQNKDFVINGSTGVITFEVATPEDAQVSYLGFDRSYASPALVFGGDMGMSLTGIWSNVATGVATRTAAAAYLGDYGMNLAVTSTSDGVQYDIPVDIMPGRVYRVAFRAKGTAADTLVVNASQNSVYTATTPDLAGTDDTVSATWRLHQFTFTATHGQLDGIQILNSTASPSGLQIDDFTVREYAPSYDIMASGNHQVPTFELWQYRVIDGVVIRKLGGCAVYSSEFASGDVYTESVSGQFLSYLLEGE